MSDRNGMEKRIVCLILAVIMLGGCWIMSLCPTWTGVTCTYRNEYEEMAQSLAEGHLWLDHEVDPILAALDNPYDPVQRRESGASFEWDHAYYNGRYYMYFGVVPVVIVFLPYLLLTGTSLTTYHATQLFYCLTVLGLFLIFDHYKKRIFKTMSLPMEMTLFTAICGMSTWYILEAPAMYCTAIMAGICFQVWSLYCFMQAVCKIENSASGAAVAVLLFLGALFGAFVFGCRPPIGLANMILLPFLFDLLKKDLEKRKISWGRWFCIAVPYIVVAALLMWYNAARFDNPFEFGQSYQITVADQSNYGSLLANIQVFKIVKGVGKAFFDPKFVPESVFPGIAFEFPIILICAASLLEKKTRMFLAEKKLMGMYFSLAGSILAIIVMQTATSPYLLERYKMDYSFLMGIEVFLCAGALIETSGKNRRAVNTALYVLSVLAMIASVVLFLVPYDTNLTSYYEEAIMEKIGLIFPFIHL